VEKIGFEGDDGWVCGIFLREGRFWNLVLRGGHAQMVLLYLYFGSCDSSAWRYIRKSDSAFLSLVRM